MPDYEVTWGRTVAKHYSMAITQSDDLLHPPLPNHTRLWGFDLYDVVGVSGNAVQRHLGCIVVANCGAPIQITFHYKLRVHHVLPVDLSIEGANIGANRASVHLHGGLVPWSNDGGPWA